MLLLYLKTFSLKTYHEDFGFSSSSPTYLYDTIGLGCMPLLVNDALLNMSTNVQKESFIKLLTWLTFHKKQIIISSSNICKITQ